MLSPLLFENGRFELINKIPMFGVCAKVLAHSNGNNYILISKSGCSTITALTIGIDCAVKKNDDIWKTAINKNVKLITSLIETRQLKNAIAFIRNPIDRFISICNHIYAFKHEPRYKAIDFSNKSKFIDSCLFYCICTNASVSVLNLDQHAISQVRTIKEIVSDKCKVTYFPIEQLKPHFNYNGVSANVSEKFVTMRDLSFHTIRQVLYTFAEDKKLYELCLKSV